MLVKISLVEVVVRSGKVEQIKCSESYESRDKDNENFAEENDFRRKNEELRKKRKRNQRDRLIPRDDSKESMTSDTYSLKYQSFLCNLCACICISNR